MGSADTQYAVKRARLDNVAGGSGSIETNVSNLNVVDAISDPKLFDPDLKEVREELASAYRILYALGINTLPYNHLTVDCNGGRFLVNRYKLSWSEVTSDNLVLVDLAGNLLEGEGPVFGPAFSVHGGVHEALGLRRARVVFHTHQAAATALACLKEFDTKVVPILSNVCASLAGKVAFDPLYNGIVNTRQEGLRLARAMGDASVLFMANHGITVCASTVSEALYLIWQTEVASNRAIQILSGANVLSDNYDKQLAEQQGDFIQRVSALPECGPPGQGSRKEAWLGRGPIAPLGYSKDDTVIRKISVDIAAAHQVLIKSDLGVTSKASSLITMIGTEGNLLIHKPGDIAWDVMHASDVKQATSLDNDLAQSTVVAATILQHKARQCPSIETPTLLICAPSASIRKLATRGSRLLPIAQDSMFFDGFTSQLSKDATLFGLEAEPSTTSVELREALLSKPLLRIAVGQELLAVFGNSPSHVMGMLQRYEKGVEMQLKAMDTNEEITFVDEDVIAQPLSQNICGSTKGDVLDAQWELAKRKLMESGVRFWE